MDSDEENSLPIQDQHNLLQEAECDTDIYRGPDGDDNCRYFSRTNLEEIGKRWRSSTPKTFQKWELLKLKAELAERLKERVEKTNKVIDDIDTLLDNHFE
jgi:hypothetical protein